MNGVKELLSDLNAGLYGLCIPSLTLSLHRFRAFYERFRDYFICYNSFIFYMLRLEPWLERQDWSCWGSGEGNHWWTVSGILYTEEGNHWCTVSGILYTGEGNHWWTVSGILYTGSEKGTFDERSQVYCILKKGTFDERSQVYCILEKGTSDERSQVYCILEKRTIDERSQVVYTGEETLVRLLLRFILHTNIS